MSLFLYTCCPFETIVGGGRSLYKGSQKLQGQRQEIIQCILTKLIKSAQILRSQHIVYHGIRRQFLYRVISI